jgi:dipeptidyl-peptidase-4
LYDAKGNLQKQLTKGKYDVTEFLGYNADGTIAFYIAASEDGLNRYCCSVDLKSGKTSVINKTNGVHTATVSADGNFILDTYSNTTTPRTTLLMDKNGKELSMLLNATNPLVNYRPCGVRLSSIPSKDGSVSLNYRMFFPPDFDSTKKYPVLVYVYGGPHAQMITNTWLGAADMWLYYMAQNGYVVFTLDNRGSSNRGLAFEQATFRKFGTIETEDQLTGISFLQSQKYIDTTRVGVFGWSFGGFMSITLKSKTPYFKVAVAGGPVIDWGMYEIMYTERYMDTPKENEQGYKESNLMNYVKGVKGKLMLIHGTDDDVVLWQHSLNYLKTCVDEGVMVDYFVYPGHKHNVLGKDRVHLMKKVAEYFKENL